MQLLTCLWSNFINICIFGNRMDFHFNSPEKKIAVFHNDPLQKFFLYVWFQISLPVSLPLLPHQSLNDWSSASLLCFFIRMNVCVCVCVCVCVWLSYVQLFVTPWTVACQAPCPWNSPGKSNEVGRHFLHHGIFLTQGLNPVSCIEGRFFTTWATREAHKNEQSTLKECFLFLHIIVFTESKQKD